jgi:hypothetical protein
VIDDASQQRLSIKQTILLVAGLVLLTAAVRVPLLGIPFERDEGEYAYIAWRLGHNELPYRDWVDQKPPGIFLLYRIALTLPLDPVRAVHLAALLISAASACALFFLARRFLSDVGAFLSAALFALLSADPWIEGTAANTEIFMLLPLVLSQIFFFRSLERSRTTMSSFVCGALIGIAIVFKQVAAVNWLLLLAMCPVFATPPERWRSSFRFGVWSLAGILAVTGVFLFYFWVRRGFADLIDNVFTHNLEYIGAMTWADRWRFCSETLTRLARTESLIWIFAFIGLISLGAKRDWKSFAFLAGWFVTSAIAVSASGYFFPHYFQQLLPSLALVAVFGVQSIGEMRLWQRSCLLRGALVLLLIFLPIKSSSPFWFNYTPAEAVRQIYPGNFFAEMPAFADRLVKVTAPDQRVFIFGAEPEILFYARRVSATRYIFLFPLYGAYPNIREKQIATTEEIKRKSPAAAVYAPNGLFFQQGTDQFFTEWSLSYLADNFLPDTCLVRQSATTATIEPARPDRPPPENMLAAIFVKNASVP